MVQTIGLTRQLGLRGKILNNKDKMEAGF